MLKWGIALGVSVVLLPVFIAHHAQAQIPPVSSPQIVSCFDDQNRAIKCGDSFTATRQGIVYDCKCNCVAPSANDCRQRSSSSGASSRSESGSSAAPERDRQIRENQVQQERFNIENEELKGGLKEGGTSTSAPGLKDGSSALPLKGSGSSTTMQMKPGTTPSIEKESIPLAQRQELLASVSETVRQRAAKPNEQAQEILKSLKTKAPPKLGKSVPALIPGDVILVGTISYKDYKENGFKFKDMAISNAINLLDRWGSNNWSSPASHTALYLGERNGKRWYLDNTLEYGPVIKEEKFFMEEYGKRKLDVATLVGEPLSPHQGEELWKAAHEARKLEIGYGIWANNYMVCSENARWALVRAGRRLPETQSKNRTIVGSDIGLNKNQFLNFSPSDFYESEQYFVIHEMSMQ